MEFDPTYLRTEAEDPAEVHDNASAMKQICSMMVLQAIYDLSSRDQWIRWDAIQYMHSEVFEGHVWEAGLDPEIVRERLIKDGKLPPEVPPPPARRR